MTRLGGEMLANSLGVHSLASAFDWRAYAPEPLRGEFKAPASGRTPKPESQGRLRARMAAATQVEMVTILVNDIEVQVPKGELIVESVKRIGLEIPIFCYHPRMKAVGMCRMCLVEVGMKQPDGSIRKMPKPQAACTLPASDGLAIYTDSEMVHTDRRGVLEFLLINHPLDCPICDRGGECPLQNNTLFYGPSTSRYVELKRHLPKAFPLSQYVTLDLERCIQCGRCVRFTEEISGDAELAFRFRGAEMQPSTFELTNFGSKFSGNVIEICPVGALTSAKYRFRARPWDLETRPSVCTQCSNGCNVWFDYRVNKVVRINGRTNEAVNEEWTCDKGKFGHDYYNSDSRLTQPLVREDNGLSPTTWAGAFTSILDNFTNGSPVAAIAGSMLSNEDLYMLQKLFRNQFGSNNIDYRFTKHQPKAGDRLEAKLGLPLSKTPIASFEEQKAVLVFGSSLSDEEPILFLRLRKAWFQNQCKVIVAHDRDTDLDSFAHLVLRYKPGTETDLAAGLSAAAGLKGADARYTPDYTAGITGVRAADIKAAAEILKEASAPVVCTRVLYDLDNGQDVLEAVATLANGIGGAFNLYSLKANDQGADELGVLPDLLPGGKAVASAGMNTAEILEACAAGEIKALWLAGCDPFSLHADQDLVARALEAVDYLVVQDIVETEATAYASLVLPMTAPAESDGTYTNMERRVQRIKQILSPKGDAKPAWKTYVEVALRIKPSTPLFNAGEVMKQIASEVPAFSAVSYDTLPEEGLILK